MLRLLLLLVIVGGGVLQSTVVAVAGVAGITPDVPLILTVLIALRYGPESGCLAGFVAGPVVAALFLSVWDMFAREHTPDPTPDPVTDSSASGS